MKPLTDQQKIDILLRREAGDTWKAIGKCYGVSGHVIHCAVDPAFGEKHKAARRKLRPDHEEQHEVHRVTKKQRPQDAIEERRAWVDCDDARDLTGVLFGDPPTGRSAFDRRSGHGGAL